MTDAGTLQVAYAYCEQVAREHYENFPVASVLLPKRMRGQIAAIYAFARTADDLADEPGRAPEERLRLLDAFRERLHTSVRPFPAAARSPQPLDPKSDHIFMALRDTIERSNLPVQLLDDLLSAFRQDVVVDRYDRWVDVADYCRRSANPVGRLVLSVAGVRDEAAARASDAVCTALQLANFWQDFGRDWRNGRLYAPAEEARLHAASERDLEGSSMTREWKAVLRACVERTRSLFEEGRPVAEAVGGRLRWQLRATWLGGMRILEKIEALDYDTLHHRPTLGAADAARIATGVLRWR